ncbi:hypothetical protein T484DRAFT_1765530, partial [Baffinella frigidus]
DILPELEEEILRLSDERDALLRTGVCRGSWYESRDALLRTGVYTDADEVIREIEKHIAQVRLEIEDVCERSDCTVKQKAGR